MDGDQEGHFLEALCEIYVSAFAPIAEQLRQKQQLDISVTPQRLPTMWKDYTLDQSSEAVFKIPDALDSLSPDLPQMASAIARSWAPGLATQSLRPVLIKLLELGQRFPASKPLKEEVSESIYVMS